jgi:hypothetical protein
LDTAVSEASLSTAQLIELMREPDLASFTTKRDTFLSVVEGGASVVEGVAQEPLSVVEPSALVEGYEGRSTKDKFSTWDVVKYAHALGFAGRPSKSLFVTLKQRLEIESGRRRPFEVPAGLLPDDVHPIVKTSYDGFLYLLQCRWLHTPHVPAPWTHPFAARWCGNITERQAKDARQQLVKMGALLFVRTDEASRAKLWLPSPPKSILMLSSASSKLRSEYTTKHRGRQ